MEIQAKKEKICCITGRRPNGFPFPYGKNGHTQAYKKQLADVILHFIQKERVTHFFTGGALGIDLDVAEIVLRLQKEYPFLTHTVVLPYENQGGRYGLNDKIRHENVMNQSEVVVLSEGYTPWCMQQRNEYMVNHADLVVAFACGEKSGGTYNTVRYAKRKKKPVYLFDLADCLKVNSTEWIRKAKKDIVEQITIDT